MITIAEMIIVVMIIMAEEMMVTTATIVTTVAVEVVIVTITEAMVDIEVEVVEEVQEIVIIADRDMEIMVVQTEIGNEVEADRTNTIPFLTFLNFFFLNFLCHEINSLTNLSKYFFLLN